MGDRNTQDTISPNSCNLIRKLIDDVDILTRFSGESDKGLLDDEDRVLSDLIKEYEHLDPAVRQELTDLATILAGGQGQALRAAICRSGRAEITIREDRMEATMELFAPEGGGKALAASEVITLLKERGIVFGVDLPAVMNGVNEVARGSKKSVKVRVAVGKGAINGEPGQIELNVGVALPARNARLKEWMVKQGDALAHIIAPTPGTPGSNVYGQEVPAAPGSTITLDTTPGVTFDEETQAYVADFDGLALYNGNQLELRRQMVWNGDLTINDQPIQFDGAVVIRGTVCDGASITATGDVEISGGIEGASVISTQGTIVVKQGITGRGRGYVFAKDLVDVKYIENGTVYCEGDILVRHAVIHSRLTAGKTIKVELGKGAIFGGDIRAGSLIVAKSLGNVAGIPTRLSVGHDWGNLKKLQECEAVLASLHQKASICEELIAKFRQAKPQISALTDAERQALCSVIKRHLMIKHGIGREQERYKSLDGAWVLKDGGDILCHETIHAGTSVKISTATLLMSNNQTGCRLRFSDADGHIVGVLPSGRKLQLS